MSYDLHCYESKLAVPDKAEIRAILDQREREFLAGIRREIDAPKAEAIASALINHNPRLIRFYPDYTAIARRRKISEEEARYQYRRIRLEPPKGDIFINLGVEDDHVFISIPYGYKNEDANLVDSFVSGYLRVIRVTAGFFVWDGQTSCAFDPLETEFSIQSRYGKLSLDLPGILAKATANQKSRKPN